MLMTDNRWDENKTPFVGKVDERIKNPATKDVVGENPAEVKKTESGESDPGYESDSNNKSGGKKFDEKKSVQKVSTKTTSDAKLSKDDLVSIL
jgi:hypothetical protein